MQNLHNYLQEKTFSIKQSILSHPLYTHIQSAEDLKTFMEFHVFAVWDFMSLLKTLQKNLTCVDVPWLPKGSAETRYLINEIVTGEESDLNLYGKRQSHFEMYLDAMEQVGANTKPIQQFLAYLQIYSLREALQKTSLHPAIENFVKFTFEIIESEKTCLQAAIFTYGREDLIPEMFMAIVEDIQTPENSLELFTYYLHRHIEIDGGHHSHLAINMTEHLCQNENWVEIEKHVVEALRKRAELWAGILETIKTNNRELLRNLTNSSNS
ncbi:MAG: DUF3050 domain-containing protein [Thermonemataceae bacterium]|nr:DUF3050 domain-containing protein [Thermonemataceae bacterium]